MTTPKFPHLKLVPSDSAKDSSALMPQQGQLLAPQAPDTKSARVTPMIQQYLEAKKQTPDCILFFRMGDFYEMFFEDAVVASQILGIQLTSRDKNNPDPIPMCGVPHHAMEAYRAKLIKEGFKVALCDQLEDPRQAKGLVKRGITSVSSPGMYTEPDHTSPYEHRYLAGLVWGREMAGFAYMDLASGEFKATSLPWGIPISSELARVNPAELVLAESQLKHPQASALSPFLPRMNYAGKPPQPDEAWRELGDKAPARHLPEHVPAVIAAAMIWSVILKNQGCSPAHIEPLALYEVETFLGLDPSARRNLELFNSLRDNSRKGSLIAAVDKTVTGMGGRLLKDWLGFPLKDKNAIEARHQAVAQLKDVPLALEDLRAIVKTMPDLPRLSGRVALNQASPREMASLRDCLRKLPNLAEVLSALDAPLITGQLQLLQGLDEVQAVLESTLAEEPSFSIGNGGVVAQGFSPELDSYRRLSSSGKDWILALQAQLREETGISSLKVSYNKVFGYYIEVTKTNLDKVPDSFIRKQTLSTGERYFTVELKEKEEAVLSAADKALALEKQIFDDLRAAVAAHGSRIRDCGNALACLDVLAGLAELANSHYYVRPRIKEEGALIIKAGRHPVVEQMLGQGEFIPNDLCLGEDNQVLIITGPNMAGKSTILRQAALIVLLAQAGSFVPADAAEIPLVDHIFTRVGAMDNLAGGQSTFMVEMSETAQILQKATPRSLVILDEVGRGTSTFDGLSLAWAVAEYLHNLAGTGVKTLFATHYHELTELAATHSRAKNYNVAVKATENNIVFLHKFEPGGVSRSYGLQVARMAGLPESVLNRAKAILNGLETEGNSLAQAAPASPADLAYLYRKPDEHPALTRLKNIDLNLVTPLDAFNLLSEIKRDLD